LVRTSLLPDCTRKYGTEKINIFLTAKKELRVIIEALKKK
jgi:hypothetical protein